MNITIIPPANLVDKARHIADCIHPAARGMYTTPVCTEANPTVITHYISSGVVDDVFEAVLIDANVMLAAAQQGALAQGIECTATLQDCEALVAQSIVSGEDGWVLLAEHGLEIYQEGGIYD